MTTHLDIAEYLRGYFSPDYKATLLEVGAAHPTMISVSYPLRAFGWNIISIEPNPEFIANFKEMNLPVLEYAACAEDKGTTTFKISPNSVSCSALEVKPNYHDYANVMGWAETDYRTIEVQAFTLNTILQKHYPVLQKIDALLIDTEGWELEILEGFDLNKYQPKVVCLENFNASLTYIQYMYGRGYRLAQKCEQDEFYVKD
jgi:FkbM family methyltransferase